MQGKGLKLHRRDEGQRDTFISISPEETQGLCVHFDLGGKEERKMLSLTLAMLEEGKRTVPESNR